MQLQCPRARNQHDQRDHPRTITPASASRHAAHRCDGVCILLAGGGQVASVLVAAGALLVHHDVGARAARVVRDGDDAWRASVRGAAAARAGERAREREQQAQARIARAGTALISTPAAMYSTTLMPKCSSSIVCSPPTAPPSSSRSSLYGTLTCHSTASHSPSCCAYSCSAARRAASSSPRQLPTSLRLDTSTGDLRPASLAAQGQGQGRSGTRARVCQCQLVKNKVQSDWSSARSAGSCRRLLPNAAAAHAEA